MTQTFTVVATPATVPSTITTTDVANLILDQLGLEANITDLASDTTSRGAAIRRRFSYIRDAMLRAYPWNFAVTRVECTEVPADGSESVSYSTGSDTGTAAPTTGSYAQGFIRWNSAPVAGGNMGWVCVSTGTPGTWKPFGVVGL